MNRERELPWEVMATHDRPPRFVGECREPGCTSVSPTSFERLTSALAWAMEHRRLEHGDPS